MATNTVILVIMVVNHIIININVVYLKEEGQQVASLGQVYNPFSILFMYFIYHLYDLYTHSHLQSFSHIQIL